MSARFIALALVVLFTSHGAFAAVPLAVDPVQEATVAPGYARAWTTEPGGRADAFLWQEPADVAVAGTRAFSLGGYTYDGPQQLDAFDALDGAHLWTASIDRGYVLRLAAREDGSAAYVTLWDSLGAEVVAYDGASGAPLWRHEVLSESGHLAQTVEPLPSRDGETVFVAVSFGAGSKLRVLALDAATGAARWSVDTPIPLRLYPSTAALSPNGTLLVIAGAGYDANGSHAAYVAFDAAMRSLAWVRLVEHSEPGASFASEDVRRVAFAGRVVYGAAAVDEHTSRARGYVHALALETGELRWSSRSDVATPLHILANPRVPAVHLVGTASGPWARVDTFALDDGAPQDGFGTRTVARAATVSPTGTSLLIAGESCWKRCGLNLREVPLDPRLHPDAALLDQLPHVPTPTGAAIAAAFAPGDARAVIIGAQQDGGLVATGFARLTEAARREPPRAPSEPPRLGEPVRELSWEAFDEADGPCFCEGGTVAAGDRVATWSVAHDGAHLRVRDAATGASAWRAPLGPSLIVSDVVLTPDGGLVLVSAHVTGDSFPFARVLAFDARTGDARWTHDSPAYVGAGPLAVSPEGNVVVAFHHDARVRPVGLLASNGAQFWSAIVPVPSHWGVTLHDATVGPDGGDAYVVGRAYAGSGHDAVALSVDAANGRVNWLRTTGADGSSRAAYVDVEATPDGRDVLVAETDERGWPTRGGAVALAASNGAIRWSAPLDGAAHAVAMDGARGTAFVVSAAPAGGSDLSYDLTALDASNGQVRWQNQSEMRSHQGFLRSHVVPLRDSVALVEGQQYDDLTFRSITRVRFLAPDDGSLLDEIRIERDGEVSLRSAHAAGPNGLVFDALVLGAPSGDLVVRLDERAPTPVELLGQMGAPVP